MRAWVLDAPGPVEGSPLVLRDLERPKLSPGQLRLRVIACGVCRTDLHVAEGDLRRPHPIIPGHQIVAHVAERGRGIAADAPREGERVGVTWLASTCGRCTFCEEGRENLCAKARFTGLDRAGGFAEEAIAGAEFVVRLPGELSSLEASPLLCAGVIGYRSFLSTGVGPGERLGLVGFGASARLTLQTARTLGCEVVVFTREEAHRQAALNMGAAEARDLGETPPAECHGIVLFAPVGALVPFCLRHLRAGGTLAINAVHASDLPSMPYELIHGERRVQSVAHVTRRDAREFLELAVNARIRAQPVPWSFTRANEALLAIKRSTIDGQAVLDVAGESAE